jgi:hypothetical protein
MQIMAGGIVSSAATRDRPPDVDDMGLVVRPIGPIGPIIPGTSTLDNGTETPVGAAAVQILAANPNRKTAVVQNTGTANIRVGAAGVTATTGLRLVPNQIAIYDEPDVPINALFAIREGAVDSVAFTQEAV